MNHFSMAGKTVVVTGAASGIGLATAERLAAAGASVVLADITDAAQHAHRLGGRFVRTDVADEQAVADLLATSAAQAPLHALVQAAGVMTEMPLAELAVTDFERLMRINTLGVLHGLKHAPAHMATGAAIVNIASLAATVAVPGYGAYAASKAAALALCRVAAVELGPLGIRVNAICPSSVDTPMLHAQDNGAAEAALSRTAAPLGTLSSAQHVAALAHFLVADDCPQISGQAINLDAGVTAGFSIELLERLSAALAAAA